MPSPTNTSPEQGADRPFAMYVSPSTFYFADNDEEESFFALGHEESRAATDITTPSPRRRHLPSRDPK